jgi:transketolase
MNANIRSMRDVIIEKITESMKKNDSVFFISADFGSPKLDALRSNFPERFINVGIAEQNLINVPTGLALEGFTVFAYAIAPFITMRCFEQIRVNLAILSELKKLNVNLVGVGAGYSYDVSGPTHQAFEDISIMRTLPNIEVFSPSDWKCAESYVEHAVSNRYPKYIRLDGKPLKNIYEDEKLFSIKQGFCELVKGDNVCIISTGFMTHKALSIAEKRDSVGVIDLYMLNDPDKRTLYETLKKYKTVITLEEGFIGAGGLDSLIFNFVNVTDLNIKIRPLGLKSKYSFNVGSREQLHSQNGVGEKDVLQAIDESKY